LTEGFVSLSESINSDNDSLGISGAWEKTLSLPPGTPGDELSRIFVSSMLVSFGSGGSAELVLYSRLFRLLRTNGSRPWKIHFPSKRT
jgi:hypothetical protein